MDAINKCDRRVIVRYYCMNRAGCKYFTPVAEGDGDWKLKRMRGYCGDYIVDTGECVSHAAKSAADKEAQGGKL
jgi:hypothetical protein